METLSKTVSLPLFSLNSHVDEAMFVQSLGHYNLKLETFLHIFVFISVGFLKYFFHRYF